MTFYDMNTAEEGREGGPIPDGSIVPVVMRVTLPHEKIGVFAGQVPEQMAHDKHLFMALDKDGHIAALCLDFTVTAGPFKGRKIFENWGIYSTDAGNEGHGKMINISRSRVRSAIEAAKVIDPKDESEAAVNARRINSLTQLSGLAFPVKVGIDDYNGKKSNTINTILTSGMAGFKPVPQPDPAGFAVPNAAPAQGGQQGGYQAPAGQAAQGDAGGW